MNEFDFIRTCLAPLAEREKGALALKDDAAILATPAGQELVITKDALVEGVHFIGDESPGLIAQKALRVNLSDLAAMGAKPYAYFLALMLPSGVNEAWLAAFAEGLRSDQETYGITLMGGDTTRTIGPLCLSVTALGFVPKGQALLRSGAKPGDDIYVSGTIGDGALGLLAAKGALHAADAARSYLIGRYQLPEPRLQLGEKLRGTATSCMDISDGLVQDLGHICAASSVGAEVEWPLIPLSDAARSAIAAIKTPEQIILAGGDDYELLFTASPGVVAGMQVTRIGRITQGACMRVLDEKGKPIELARKGYTHF